MVAGSAARILLPSYSEGQGAQRCERMLGRGTSWRKGHDAVARTVLEELMSVILRIIYWFRGLFTPKVKVLPPAIGFQPTQPVAMLAEPTKVAIGFQPILMPVEPAPTPAPVPMEIPKIRLDRRTTAHLNYTPATRPWKSVTGICLHQTACLLGERPARWDTVGAHIGVTRSGRVIWLHDFDRIVWHGNRWNAGTVGIEIDGLYEGVKGNPKTVWDDPSTATHEQGMIATPEAIEATKQTIRWICSVVAENGGAVKALVAHRQSSMNRRNDPGSELWQAVALPLHAELKLNDGGVGFTVGGLPIPEEWDPRCRGIKY
jgi:hypothetical protein